MYSYFIQKQHVFKEMNNYVHHLLYKKNHYFAPKRASRPSALQYNDVLKIILKPIILLLVQHQN